MEMEEEMEIDAPHVKMDKPILSNCFVEEVASKLLDTGKQSDVRIVLDNGSSYNLHKAILAAHSPVLRAMFYYHPGKIEHHLGMVTKRGFEGVLAHIYTNAPTIFKPANEKIEQAADFLGI